MSEQGTITATFKVESFRRIPNPYLKSEEGNAGAGMYVAICDVLDVPENFPMETNPREQKMTTGVAKKIRESLLNTGEASFYLLNRGILLSAASVAYSNYSGELTVTFEDTEVHGNVDGGHTYRTIIANRDQLERGQQFVKLEILTGIEDIFQDLAGARNTSVQVQDKSIAELEDRFDIIKRALGGEPYFDRIVFKENDQSGDIDVADMLSVLTMFNVSRYEGMSSFPIAAYNSKKKCIDMYIEEHKAHGDGPDNAFVKMSAIMPDIFRLYDAVESGMGDFYREKNPGGRYGATKGVVVAKKGKKPTSKFFGTEMEASSPNGFVYPVLSAFRALVEERGGVYRWKADPFAILEKVGGDLVDSTVLMSRSLGNNPTAVGKDPNIWKTLYMTVAFAAM